MPAQVAVIVPARDEGETIASCLAGLRGQTYPPDRVQLLVVDDHSSDGTAAIVAAVAARCPRLRQLTCPSLPQRWTGKSHACSVGADSVADDVEWLCFMDADTRARPRLLTAALAEAEKQRLDFLTLTPRQVLLGFAERLVMPCGFYFLAFAQDLGRLQDPGSGEATATGQFILVRHRAYRAIGGHGAVRADISEDVALARLFKRQGYRIHIAGGDALFETRMYTGWQSLWIGVSKNLVDMMGGSAATVLAAVAGLILSWLALALPVVAAGAARSGPATWPALAAALPASLAVFAFHLAGARHFGIPPGTGCCFHSATPAER